MRQRTDAGPAAAKTERGSLTRERGVSTRISRLALCRTRCGHGTGVTVQVLAGAIAPPNHSRPLTGN